MPSPVPRRVSGEVPSRPAQAPSSVRDAEDAGKPSPRGAPVAGKPAPGVHEPIWLVRIVLVLVLVGFAAFLAREWRNFLDVLP